MACFTHYPTSFPVSQEQQSLGGKLMKFAKLTVLFIVITLLVPALSFAESDFSWLSISGDYQARHDMLSGTVADYYSFQDVLAWQMGGPAPSLTQGYDVDNSSLLTNRFRLNLQAKATENVSVKSRLVMYKAWGEGSDTVDAGYFGDRMFIFDGVAGHVPQDNVLRVDTAYATWSNIFGQPIWFSIGRRPSTSGIPTHIKRNEEKTGTAGVPGLLVDYAFDGLTIGYAPYIEALPGAFVKFCYGKGTETGYETSTGPGIANDTDFLGFNVVPFDNDIVHVEVQWNRAIGIFDDPNNPTTNLGDVDQYGTVVTGNLGKAQLFLSAAMSQTHPNDNLYMVDTNGDGVGDMGVAGLMYDAPAMGGKKESQTGYAIYAGGRYDFDTGTKIGAEYNFGSQYWLTFGPAADDMWTSKLGTRGSVVELYLIQDLNDVAVSKNGKAFFRLGYQYYTFDYTGSNNWLGEPKDMGELDNPMNAQMLPPVENAQDIYLTFNVTF